MCVYLHPQMRQVTVQALKSFDGLVEGETYLLWMEERVAHLIVGHYLRLLEDPLWHTPSASTGSPPLSSPAKPAHD